MICLESRRSTIHRRTVSAFVYVGCTGNAHSGDIDDVLKARLKTVGVSEYRFEMEAGSESGTQWRIIDVGGSRSQVRTMPTSLCDSDLISPVEA